MDGLERMLCTFKGCHKNVAISFNVFADRRRPGVFCWITDDKDQEWTERNTASPFDRQEEHHGCAQRSQ
jgi:hypothetical protein